jgi:hypothetical protein
MGLEWARLFLPFWIFFSGGSAISARYLAWKFLNNQIVAVITAGALGALLSDAAMAVTLFRPFAVGRDLLPGRIVMTAAFGAAVAAGLAWAERSIPYKNLTTSDTSATEDRPRT